MGYFVAIAFFGGIVVFVRRVLPASFWLVLSFLIVTSRSPRKASLAGGEHPARELSFFASKRSRRAHLSLVACVATLSLQCDRRRFLAPHHLAWHYLCELG